ncbi:hypothetical protein RD792_015870 [Penstemon davidsonii]|uniref:Bidirectional sugar transporter SWEET n=1 Tax=Penstemon davidsonii TaxID=160366 RepID=A0ABR0CJ01_9LAMI|nr:hypothetical protein RD792_015870 [Penstemon davidsonii]
MANAKGIVFGVPDANYPNIAALTRGCPPGCPLALRKFPSPADDPLNACLPASAGDGLRKSLFIVSTLALAAGNVISILMFASPIKTFNKVVRKKSTENYKGVPYITTLLSTCLWTFYGVLKPDVLVVTVNGAGAALHVAFVILFLIYAPKTIRVKSIKLAGAVNVGFLGAVLIVTLVALGSSSRVSVVGFVCAGLTIGMYAAPLSAMRTVIRTKSIKYMPFFLSFLQFLNSGVWSAYALLIRDFYIGVPNVIGFVLSSAQLILITLYYKDKSSPELEEKMQMEEEEEEEGSAHLFKGNIQMQEYLDGNNDPSLLSKGNSLPKPSVVRQYSNNIMKTRSLSPYDLATNFNQKDMENGFKD